METLTAWLYLAPNLAGFLVFTAGPVLAVFAMAGFAGDFVSRFEWVGLANFAELAGDRRFLRSLWNTLVLMSAIPVGMALSLALALLLHQKVRGRVVLRTIFFLPSITSGIALFLLWRWIYNPEFGLVNEALRALGVEGPNWLRDAFWAKPALMFMGLWMGIGGHNMVLYLAGLQHIDPTLYQAAELDGAGPWARFRHVTWPSLSTTTFFIFTTNVIGGFQVFDQAYVMTRGGPDGATTTVLYYIFELLYVDQRVGYAAAVSVALFALVLAVTLANWRLGRSGGAR
ncbi:MAG: sugar ABC transporter permease [Planctomycetes bacterium]|nr:sugar ABC transporter permease [Planctomycetota bacterium]